VTPRQIAFIGQALEGTFPRFLWNRRDGAREVVGFKNYSRDLLGNCAPVEPEINDYPSVVAPFGALDDREAFFPEHFDQPTVLRADAHESHPRNFGLLDSGE
jgi:hypothetical protein